MIQTGQDVIHKEPKSILITQPKPESDKSPYFDLAKKYNVELTFYPFIRLEHIAAREFRKQKIDIQQYTAVILTSRNAIDHFFRMCDEDYRIAGNALFLHYRGGGFISAEIYFVQEKKSFLWQ